MLDQQKGNFIFECDGGCSEILETNTSDFDSAQNFRKRNRWSIYRDRKDEWCHLCPECTDKVSRGKAW